MAGGLKSLLVNRYEAITDQQLREAAAKRGMRVCPKVGVADVLKIEHSGISDEDYGYALKAHFDFVLATDDEIAHPLFGVEFDGGRHRTDRRVATLDARKNALCQRFRFPLLRIDEAWLEPIRQWTILKWIIEVQALYDAWTQEQEEGHIPWTEDFYWPFVIETDNTGRIVDRPYDLAAEALTEMHMACRRGVTIAHVNETLTSEDDQGYTVAHGILPLTAGGYIIETARCWSFSFPPVSPSELAEDLVLVAVATTLRQYELGAYTPHSEEQLAALRARTNGWLRQGMLLKDVPYSR